MKCAPSPTRILITKSSCLTTSPLRPRMDVVNLDAFALFRVGCVASGFNYVTKLYTSTILSAVYIIAVFFR